MASALTGKPRLVVPTPRCVTTTKRKSIQNARKPVHIESNHQQPCRLVSLGVVDGEAPLSLKAKTATSKVTYKCPKFSCHQLAPTSGPSLWGPGIYIYIHIYIHTMYRHLDHLGSGFYVDDTALNPH